MTLDRDDLTIVTRAQRVVMQTRQLSDSSALAAMQRCARRNEVDLLAVALLVNATLTLPPDPDGRFDARVPDAASPAAAVGELDAGAQLLRAQGILMQRDETSAADALDDIHACADKLGLDAATVAAVLVETVASTRRRSPSG